MTASPCVPRNAQYKIAQRSLEGHRGQLRGGKPYAGLAGLQLAEDLLLDVLVDRAERRGGQRLPGDLRPGPKIDRGAGPSEEVL